MRIFLLTILLSLLSLSSGQYAAFDTMAVEQPLHYSQQLPMQPIQALQPAQQRTTYIPIGDNTYLTHVPLQQTGHVTEQGEAIMQHPHTGQLFVVDQEQELQLAHPNVHATAAEEEYSTQGIGGGMGYGGLGYGGFGGFGLGGGFGGYGLGGGKGGGAAVAAVVPIMGGKGGFGAGGFGGPPMKHGPPPAPGFGFGGPGAGGKKGGGMGYGLAILQPVQPVQTFALAAAPVMQKQQPIIQFQQPIMTSKKQPMISQPVVQSTKNVQYAQPIVQYAQPIVQPVNLQQPILQTQEMTAQPIVQSSFQEAPLITTQAVQQQAPLITKGGNQQFAGNMGGYGAY